MSEKKIKANARTENIREKFKFSDGEGGGAFYVNVERNRDGYAVGPVVGIRINYKHARGSQMDVCLEKVSDFLTRQVQTVEKALVE
jgi:hypothetical protein